MSVEMAFYVFSGLVVVSLVLRSSLIYYGLSKYSKTR